MQVTDETSDNDPHPSTSSVPIVEPAPTSPLRKLFFVTLAVAPFLSLYLAHCYGTGTPTGFIQYDQAYYCANGRAVFERGNGFAHPNPYDPDPKAPVIYFHWFTWALGLGIVHLGLDPGLLYVITAVVAGLLCSWLTFRIVEIALPSRRFLIPLFLLTSWGGGVLCLTAIIMSLVRGLPILQDLFYYDPHYGWWFLNWGRNLVYPTEALYHVLMIATWIFLLRRRWKSALLASAALAATHPFSGLQILLTTSAWLFIQGLRQSSRRIWCCWTVSVGFLCVFFWYYALYLPSFDQHVKLEKTWSLAWVLPAPTMLLAYGPLAMIVGIRVRIERPHLSQQVVFLTLCFAISFLLATHNWFVKPRQPLHFTRGTIWMPLCLIALPQLQQWLTRLRNVCTRAQFMRVIILCGFLAVLDNACFVLSYWRNPDSSKALYLEPAARETFQFANQQRLTGVLLCPYDSTSYLAATYTPLRPYYGHYFNTPDRQERAGHVESWLTNGEPFDGLDGIDYLLIKKTDLKPLHDMIKWTCQHENETYVLFGRSKE